MSSFTIVGWRKVWFVCSAILLAISIVAVAVWGLRFGIDFTGGSLMGFRFEGTRPPVAEVVETIKQTGIDTGEPVVQPVGEQEVQVRTKALSQEQYAQVVQGLRAKHGDLIEQRFDAIGPVIGAELRQKSLQGIILALLLIMAYIAYTFRKVSAPVASWKYGAVTMLAAIHDIVIPLGVFAALGHFYGVEIGTPFVAALLTILGYSITDTIVVMDRVRENLPRMKASFEEVVSFSLKQTYLRSIYTSCTTLFVLLSIFLFGGRSMHEFTLAMMLGILVGTYSSIFVAPMVLVSWNEYTQKRLKK